MEDCIFCKIAKGTIPSSKIWEDSEIVAFLDINPISPGHTLVIPKKHVDEVFDIEEPLYTSLFKAAKKLSHPIKKATQAKRVGVIIEGFLVRHAHVHLIPLGNGGSMSFTDARPATKEELDEISKKIRAQL